MHIREKIRQAIESNVRHTCSLHDIWDYFRRLEGERDDARAEADRAQAQAATLRTALEDAKAAQAEAQRRLGETQAALRAERARAAKLEAEVERERKKASRYWRESVEAGINNMGAEEAKQRLVDALTQCAKERNRALERIKGLQARVEEDAEEIVRLRDAYDDQSTQLRRLQDTIDALTDPSAPKPSFGCHVPGVPPRVVCVASGPVQKGDTVYVDDRDHLVKGLEAERDRWIDRVRELEDQLRRVREVVR